MKDIIEQIQGKAITINTVQIHSGFSQIDLTLNIVLEGREFTLMFYEVSDLCLNNITYPIFVSGIEFIDNTYRGWEKHVRYKIQDYEDGIIKFYCRDIECRVNH